MPFTFFPLLLTTVDWTPDLLLLSLMMTWRGCGVLTLLLLSMWSQDADFCSRSCLKVYYRQLSFYILLWCIILHNSSYHMYVCKGMKLAVNVAFQPLSLLSSLSLSISLSPSPSPPSLIFLPFLSSCIIYNEHSVYIIHLHVYHTIHLHTLNS